MTAYRSLASLAPVTIVAVSLAFLNTLLSFQNVWPTPWVRPTAEISVEIVVLVLLLALAAEFRAPPALRRLAVAIVFVLVIGRYADVTAPALFGRRIDLYWDAPHLPNVVAMFVGVAPAWQTAATALGLVALFLALGWAIARAIAAVSGAFAAPRRALRGNVDGTEGTVAVPPEPGQPGPPTRDPLDPPEGQEP